MQATFIPSKEINSDLGVVNAARVSLGKKSELYCDKHSFFKSDSLHKLSPDCTYRLCDNDTKLINYLAAHNHWTPFAHARIYIQIGWITQRQELHFYKNINRGGVEYIERRRSNHSPTDLIKGSLYSWLNNAMYLPKPDREALYDTISRLYPTVGHAFGLDYPSFSYGYTSIDFSEELIKSQDFVEEPKFYKVLCATLLVKVPIFIARQMRTSQVGIAYSDLYVEGESFVFNEVSRRYVNDNPEFYSIDKWRVREGGSVKQGSTGVGNEDIQWKGEFYQTSILDYAGDYYRNTPLAPEQARGLLPQSMYTEFYMTATLHRWAQFLTLRLEEHVQEETRYIASRILDELEVEFPKWYSNYATEAWRANYIEKVD